MHILIRTLRRHARTLSVLVIAALLAGLATWKTVQFSASVLQNADFPAFTHTVFPVNAVPNWGAMRTSEEWNRRYDDMSSEDMVPVPAYNLSLLTIPLRDLTDPIEPASVPILTAKLFYSTRFFGDYDLDAGEFTGIHAGVDLKLAPGTPVRAIASGRVQTVTEDEILGLHAVIEHRLPSGERLFSVYGHLATARVEPGQNIVAGRVIGTVGLTGNTDVPHLHLQVDRDDGTEPHVPYDPLFLPSPGEATEFTVNPVTFITAHARAE